MERAGARSATTPGRGPTAGGPNLADAIAAVETRLERAKSEAARQNTRVIELMAVLETLHGVGTGRLPISRQVAGPAPAGGAAWHG